MKNSHRCVLLNPIFNVVYYICPGVTIGDNVVVGAGSVVTKDIPSWSVAAGNPCKVLREITDDDIKYYFRNETPDEEAKTDIERIWEESNDSEKFPFRYNL